MKLRDAIPVAVLASSLSASALAQAPPAAGASPAPEVPKPSYTLAANLGMASNYVFRGLTQTDGKPAIQGGIDFSHTSGLYLGTWMSNISWFTDQNAGFASTPVALSSPGGAGAPYGAYSSNNASLEWDFYGGFKGTFAADWSYDLGIIDYYYPGTYDNMGAYRKPNTTEVYGVLGYKWLSFKYSQAISTFIFGVNESKGAGYADLSGTIPLGASGFKILAHAGRYTYPKNPNTGYRGSSGGDNSYFSYTDYKVGMTLDKWGYTFGVAYTNANSKDAAPDGEATAYKNAFGRNIGHGQGAVTITKSFASSW